MSLRTRLRQLEAVAPDPGCPACLDRRGRIVLVTSRRLTDGAVVPEEGEPGPCPRCGEVPEFVIEVVEIVVDGVAGESQPPGREGSLPP